MKKFKCLLLSVLALSLVLVFASCGSSAERVTLTTDNAESYFDVDYGIDIAQKTEENTFITEGQFFVSAAAKKTEYNLDGVELTFQVTYKVETSSAEPVTKTKQVTLKIGDIVGNDMEVFVEKYSDTEEYPEITIVAVKISAVKGNVKV